MTIRLGVVMDPIEQVNYKKDSTLAMLWAADERGWHIDYMTLSDLYITAGLRARRCARSPHSKTPTTFISSTTPKTSTLENLTSF